MTIRIDSAGRAIARPADTVHPDAKTVRFRTDDAGNRWVPAAPYLPTYTPGLIYESPDISGMHDILTYAALQIACQREGAARAYPSYDPIDWPSRIALRQPDDPGIDPPAMRSSWQDDEPANPRRTRAYWALAWFFIVATPALAVIALWQALPDFWRRS